MSTSRIPAAVVAFKTLAATALPSLDIRQGIPPVSDPVRGLYVLAGFEGDTVDTAPVDASQAWAGNGARARNEDFSIPCVLFRRTGNSDQATAVAEMNAVFTDFAALETALRGDPTLGGIAQINGGAEIADSFSFWQHNQGGLVTLIAFTVSVQARI